MTTGPTRMPNWPWCVVSAQKNRTQRPKARGSNIGKVTRIWRILAVMSVRNGSVWKVSFVVDQNSTYLLAFRFKINISAKVGFYSYIRLLYPFLEVKRYFNTLSWPYHDEKQNIKTKIYAYKFSLKRFYTIR